MGVLSILRTIVVSLIILSVPDQTRGVPPPPPSGEIAGIVVTGSPGENPLRRAVVTLASESLETPVQVISDDTGRFKFSQLPAGRYVLSVAKTAYLPTTYGASRPGGPGSALLIRDGQHIANLRVPIVLGSVLVGHVSDHLGQPLEGVVVIPLRFGTSSYTGLRTPLPVSVGLDRVVTDDRGDYRLYGLQPGQYVVAALADARRVDTFRVTTDAEVRRADQLSRAPSLSGVVVGSVPIPEKTFKWPPVFHPSALSHLSANVVNLGPEEERRGVDITTRIVATARIVGVVVNPDGSPAKNAAILVADAQAILGTTIGVFRSVMPSDDQGKFEIPDLAPGRYTVIATPGGVLKASTDVDIDGEDVRVSLSLIRARRVSGRVVFDSKVERPDLSSKVLLTLTGNYSWVQRMNGPMTVAADGSFVIPDIWPGTYRLTARTAGVQGWRVKSAVIGGVDVLDAPFEVLPGDDVRDVLVTLTDQPTGISGHLFDSAGDAVTKYVILLYSSEPRYWGPNSGRVRVVRPGSDGSYRVRDLPAGSYLLSAVTDVEPGQWNDSAYLGSLAATGPVKVTIADGQEQVQDIKVK